MAISFECKAHLASVMASETAKTCFTRWRAARFGMVKLHLEIVGAHVILASTPVITSKKVKFGIFYLTYNFSASENESYARCS